MTTRMVGARVGQVCRSLTMATLVLCSLVSCKTPAEHRQEANEVANRIIDAAQKEALGRTEPFTVRSAADVLRRRLIVEQNLPISGPASLGAEALPRIEHWPEDDYPARYQPGESPVEGERLEVLELTLNEALEVAARNARDFQTQKENVFLTALDLDLAVDQFRNTYDGLLESVLIHDRAGDDPVTGIENVGAFSISRRLESGARLAGRIGIDLAQLLTEPRESSIGLIADASISIPLLRGAGRHIVYEPVTQAQRNVIYAIWDFEDFKQDFAVRIARQYFQVLQQEDTVQNQAQNYRRVIITARRTRRLADAGRQKQYDVGQSLQEELRARDQWIQAIQRLEGTMDSFKILLGVPTDADVVLDRSVLDTLAEVAEERIGEENAPSLDAEKEVVHFDTEPEIKLPGREGAGPLELEAEEAFKLALENRLDLRIEQGEVFDAQRRVVIAANALEAQLDLVATAASAGGRRSLGSADADNVRLRPERGLYTAGISLDLPWERTAERNNYREAYINLERAVRSVQQVEDQIKQQIREDLRTLSRTRETYRIQVVAKALAEQRVVSADMLYQAGRSNQVRDVLEAQAALLNAENSLTAALVNYRIAELQLQRDMGVLQVDERGLWREYDPTDRR